MNALRLALAATLLLSPAPAVGCSISKITGTWSVQVVEVTSDNYAPPELPPGVARADCLFSIAKSGEKGVAAVMIRCDDEIGQMFASAHRDFPEIASDHELVKQAAREIVAADGTLLPAPRLCEWKLIDRADIDGAEYTVRFGAPDARGKMRVLQLSGRGYQDHHFGSTEPKATTGSGILQ